MKKKPIIFALSLLFVLAGCDSNGHKELSPSTSGEYNPVVGNKLNNFKLKDIDVSLVLNETYNLTPVFQPILKNIPGISYKSSDSSVVSVDANGTITGKSAGFAIITANCGDFSSECYVSVTQEGTKTTGEKNLDAIRKEQAKEDFVKPDYLRIQERSNNVLTQNGEVMNESEGFEETVMSKSNAYIYIVDDYEKRQGVVNGNQTYAASKWLFYCTDEFETFIYHEVNSIRRYIKVDCAKYIESGDRWGAVGEVMGNLFSNYFTILERQFSTVADAEKMSEDLGSVDDARADSSGNVYAMTHDAYSKQRMDYDLASIFGIPASGGLCNIAMDDEYYYYNNYCRYYNFSQIASYKWRGDSYVYSQMGWRSYDIEEKELYYPDIKAEGWTEGEDIFDI